MDDQQSPGLEVSPPAPEPPEPELSPEEERQQQSEYARNIVPPRQPKARWPRYVLGLVILIVVLVVVGLGLTKHKATAPSSKKTTTTKVAPTETSASTGTTNYISKGTDLNLSFDYPSSWTATPVSGGNTTDQPISVSSPLVSMTAANGSSVTGKVVLQIRPVNSQLNELGNGATAAQASVQYAYSKPTTSQHNYFYLTFVHAAGASNPAGSFQEIFVTGVGTFNPGDSLTPSSITVDPIISASFYSCTSTTCSGASAVPLSITNATWQNADIFKQTLTTLESLQLN